MWRTEVEITHTFHRNRLLDTAQRAKHLRVRCKHRARLQPAPSVHATSGHVIKIPTRAYLAHRDNELDNSTFPDTRCVPWKDKEDNRVYWALLLISFVRVEERCGRTVGPRLRGPGDEISWTKRCVIFEWFRRQFGRRCCEFSSPGSSASLRTTPPTDFRCTVSAREYTRHLVLYPIFVYTWLQRGVCENLN